MPRMKLKCVPAGWGLRRCDAGPEWAELLGLGSLAVCPLQHASQPREGEDPETLAFPWGGFNHCLRKWVAKYGQSHKE